MGWVASYVLVAFGGASTSRVVGLGWRLKPIGRSGGTSRTPPTFPDWRRICNGKAVGGRPPEQWFKPEDRTFRDPRTLHYRKPPGLCDESESTTSDRRLAENPALTPWTDASMPMMHQSFMDIENEFWLRYRCSPFPRWDWQLPEDSSRWIDVGSRVCPSASRKERDKTKVEYQAWAQARELLRNCEADAWLRSPWRLCYRNFFQPTTLFLSRLKKPVPSRVLDKLRSRAGGASTNLPQLEKKLRLLVRNNNDSWSHTELIETFTREENDVICEVGKPLLVGDVESGLDQLWKIAASRVELQGDQLQVEGVDFLSDQPFRWGQSVNMKVTVSNAAHVEILKDVWGYDFRAVVQFPFSLVPVWGAARLHVSGEPGPDKIAAWINWLTMSASCDGTQDTQWRGAEITQLWPWGEESNQWGRHG